MVVAHVVVCIPKNGRGAHLENLSLALDGRGRTCIAQKGVLDSQEHLGSFFWLVSRTSTASQANLFLEHAILEQLVKVSPLGPKKRKVVSVPSESSAIIAIPVLVNKKTLKKHTQLFVFQKDNQKCEKNEEIEQEYSTF